MNVAKTLKAFSKSPFGLNQCKVLHELCSERCNENIGAARSLYRRIQKHDNYFFLVIFNGL